MSFLKQTALFGLGGSAYVGLEFLWRGRSDVSMFVAGGSCFLLLGTLDKRLSRLPLPARAVVGAAAVTAVELCVGLLVNRDYSVWDYRHVWGNFLGQICLPFSLLWIPVSMGGMVLHRLVTRRR